MDAGAVAITADNPTFLSPTGDEALKPFICETNSAGSRSEYSLVAEIIREMKLIVQQLSFRNFGNFTQCKRVGRI